MRETLFTAWTEQVKEYIQKIAEHSFQGTEVGKVLDEVLAVSGKMFRARLLLLCGYLGPDWEAKKEKLYQLAAMVELTHLASLIHDDIVDDSPYRRGKPSIQGKYGKDIAVYAGDFLMARIYYYEAVEHLNDSAAILSKAVETMCTGEIGQDLCRYREDVTVEEYFRNMEGKTATLFEAACCIGGRESGCSKELVEKLSLFGKNLGFMFQLKDDLLDFTSNLKEMGKETHKDFQNGIYTFPVITALQHQEARNYLLPVMQENKEKKLSEKEMKQMEEWVSQYGGVKRTYEEIKRLSNSNRRLIKEFPNKEEVISLFLEMLDLLEE